MESNTECAKVPLLDEECEQKAGLVNVKVAAPDAIPEVEREAEDFASEAGRERKWFLRKLIIASCLLALSVGIGTIGYRLGGAVMGVGLLAYLLKCTFEEFPGVSSTLVRRLVVCAVVYHLTCGIIGFTSARAVLAAMDYDWWTVLENAGVSALSILVVSVLLPWYQAMNEEFLSTSLTSLEATEFTV